MNTNLPAAHASSFYKPIFHSQKRIHGSSHSENQRRRTLIIGGFCPSEVSHDGVVSPLLFLLHTYEIPLSVQRFGVFCKMYADELKVYKEVENEEASCDVQAAINFVQKWRITWKLPLSAKKPHCLVAQSKYQGQVPVSFSIHA